MLAALRDAIHNINRQLQQAEEVVAATLQHNIGAITGNLGVFLMPRPGLADVSSWPTSSSYLGFAH